MTPLLVLAAHLVMADGDTLTLDSQRYRLFGIDAPELSQLCQHPSGYDYHCGAAALLHLDELVADRPVRCEGSEPGQTVDRYGRRLGICYAGDDRASLNERMVSDGYASAYRRYSMAYALDEDAARRERRGLWAGTFPSPERFRYARHR